MTCDSPYWVLPKAAFEKVPVPCGRCPPCKLRRVNSWVFRLMQEERVSLSSHFVTLTYDTRFVPISDNGFMTLKKSDFQLYMKRLRKLCPNSILKYYAVGEYGSQNSRPHYHAIIFNVPNVSFIADAWAVDGNSIGAVHVGKCTGDSVAYTMKYIDKPGRIPVHSRDDRIPEFPLMSKGLGASYLTDSVISYHQSDLARLFLTKPGGHKIALPRYYRERIYSPVDLKKQVVLIASSMEEQSISDRREYDLLYGDNPNYTFEDWVTSRRFGRYKNFYSSLKSRSL